MALPIAGALARTVLPNVLPVVTSLLPGGGQPQPPQQGAPAAQNSFLGALVGKLLGKG